MKDLLPKWGSYFAEGLAPNWVSRSASLVYSAVKALSRLPKLALHSIFYLGGFANRPYIGHAMISLFDIFVRHFAFIIGSVRDGLSKSNSIHEVK